jgi:hypothetical protein
MQVIDEKPKRGYEKVKQQSKRRLWKIAFVVSCVMFLGLSFAYLGLCVRMSDCGFPTSQHSIYLTVTAIIRTNMAVEAQLTVTYLPILPHPSSFMASRVATTATAISIQQTQLAATESVLRTQQAQLIPTLAAMTTGAP